MSGMLHETRGAGVDPGAAQSYLGGGETLLTVKSSISLTDEQHAIRAVTGTRHSRGS